MLFTAIISFILRKSLWVGAGNCDYKREELGENARTQLLKGTPASLLSACSLLTLSCPLALLVANGKIRI